MKYGLVEPVPLSLLQDDENDTIFGQVTIDNRAKFSEGFEQFIPHRLDVSALCLCLQGGADVVIDTQSFSMRKNSLCVVFPNTIIQFKHKTMDFVGYSIYDTSNSVNSLRISSPVDHFLYIKSNPCIALSDRDMKMLLELFSTVKIKNAEINHPYRERIVGNLVENICFEIASIYSQRREQHPLTLSRQEIIFRDFILLVAEHFQRQRRIDFYAQKLFITPRHLSEVVKQVSGRPASLWITDQVVLYAKVLLLERETTVSQIVDRLNFPNASFFCQFFKKNTGYSPKAYQKMAQERR